MADKETTQQDSGDTEGKDSGNKLPSPAEKYKNSYEADRKRLAAEHGQA